MNTFQKQARQGDVFLKRISAMPKGVVELPRENGKVVLAHGEVTGHMHAISERHVAHFRVDDVKADIKEGQRLRAGGAMAMTYIKVEAPCVLTHDEHDPIEIQPGVYEVRRQREYVRGQIRNVAD